MTSNRFRSYLIRLSSLLLGSGLRLEAQAPACPQAFTEQQNRTLTEYVRKKYKIPEKVALSLKKNISVRDTCFREITFEGKSAFKTWELTLYASPDARFLSSELLDTTVDPVLEQRAKDEALMKGMLQGPIATRGPVNAPVTIVEFSDFQCPFCRKFAAILDEVLSATEKTFVLSSTTCRSACIPGREWRPRLQAVPNCRAARPSGHYTIRSLRIKARSMLRTRRRNWASWRKVVRESGRRRFRSALTPECPSGSYSRTWTSRRHFR
jgi:hypothetical protein